MTVDNMREYLVQKYGPTIKGKAVKNMHDSQVVAIYKSVLSRKPVETKKKEWHPDEHYEQLSFLG